MELQYKEYQEKTKHALIDCLLGDRIGGGCFRDVYIHRLDSSLVIKVHQYHPRTDFVTQMDKSANTREMFLWTEVSRLSGYQAPNKTTKKRLQAAKDMLSPCVWLSDCGTVLVQKRTVEMEPRHIPKKVPKMFNDLKMENFGWLPNNWDDWTEGGRVVCHDYGEVMHFQDFITQKYMFDNTKMINIKKEAWG